MSAAIREDKQGLSANDLDSTVSDLGCSLETRVSFTDKVLIRDVGGEAVVLHLEQEKFFGLDEVALRMVSLLREHGRVEPVYRSLLDEYDVPADQLRRDLLGFVDLLARRDLLRIDE